MLIKSFAEVQSRRPNRQTVPVPAWGGNVVVTKLPAIDKIELVEQFEGVELDGDRRMVQQSDCIEWGVTLLSKAIVGDDGVRLFDSDEARAFLATEDPSTLQPLLDAAIAINRLGGTVEKKDASSS